MAAQVASSGKGAVASAALMRLLLLAVIGGRGGGHVRHAHVLDSSHMLLHVGEALDGHGHGAGDMHGRLHDSGRVVGSRHVVGRVGGMLGEVR